MNDKKTEFMAHNQELATNISSGSHKSLEEVKNFKYLGSRMGNTEDLELRTATVWSTYLKSKTVRSSPLSSEINIRWFLATIESCMGVTKAC